MPKPCPQGHLWKADVSKTWHLACFACIMRPHSLDSLAKLVVVAGRHDSNAQSLAHPAGGAQNWQPAHLSVGAYATRSLRDSPSGKLSFASKIVPSGTSGASGAFCAGATGAGDRRRPAVSERRKARDLSLGTAPCPRPQVPDGEALVRTMAVALNFFDVIQAMGAMPSTVAGRAVLQLGNLPGSDFAGIVLDSSIPTMQGGDEVFGVAEGSLRSFIDGKSWLAALIPKPTDFIQAASLPTVSLTVASAVSFGRVVPGELVLLHAGAGGTGCAGLAALRRAGARVAATAGSAKKQCFLRISGVSNVSSSRSGHAFFLDFDLHCASLVVNS
ncbi:unnamed protein product [Effrenium voratum]|nr:unnamed protein product [Effrenium voratum]